MGNSAIFIKIMNNLYHQEQLHDLCKLQTTVHSFGFIFEDEKWKLCFPYHWNCVCEESVVWWVE